MTEQANKNCFNPKEFVVERIEDSFLRLRKLSVCLIIFSVLALLVTFSPFSAFVVGEHAIYLVLIALFVYFIFSIIPITLLIFIVLRLTDVDGVLSKHDCGEAKDFEFQLRSLRNLAITCIVFWFLFPILGIILGFILRRRMRDVRNMWMVRFNSETTLEVTESQE